MRKKKDMDMVIARATKRVTFQKVRQAEPHCVKKGSISGETDLALSAEETKQTGTNLDQSNVTSKRRKSIRALPMLRGNGSGP